MNAHRRETSALSYVAPRGLEMPKITQPSLCQHPQLGHPQAGVPTPAGTSVHIISYTLELGVPVTRPPLPFFQRRAGATKGPRSLPGDGPEENL